jgi:hypothetical protein
MKRQRLQILTSQESRILLVSYMRRGLGPLGKKDTPSGQNGVPNKDNSNKRDLSFEPVRQQGPMPVVQIPESVGGMFDFSLKLLDQALRRHNRSLERFHDVLDNNSFFSPVPGSRTFLPEKAFIARAMAVLGVLRYPDVAELNGFTRKVDPDGESLGEEGRG